MAPRPKARRVSAPRFINHSYPSFYACYLLKSVAKTKTGRTSNTTYIGSTPNPPRRIRQHNGEITSGAWKTRRNRPWVMQLIVHGFPSRMAALQFEWAMQHPYRSRHLKDEDGKPLFSQYGRFMKKIIETLKAMISTHPYDRMSLHVKLFTEEAEKCWMETSKNKSAERLSLPKGMICSVEIEGVDGKSGRIGSGRTGPIAVKDEQFTTTHLHKSMALQASLDYTRCSVCNAQVNNFAPDPLSFALCPSSGCTAISHLRCLSSLFLENSNESSLKMIPRGGVCPSCHGYILWGDVVRGCYRRAAGGATIIEVDEVDDAEGEMFASDEDPVLEADAVIKEPRKGKGKARTKSKSTSKKPSTKKAKTKNGKPGAGPEESEGEFFDFDAITPDTSDGEMPTTPRKRGRPPKDKNSDSPKRLKTATGSAVPIATSNSPKRRGSPVSVKSDSPTKPEREKRGRPKLTTMEGPTSARGFHTVPSSRDIEVTRLHSGSLNDLDFSPAPAPLRAPVRPGQNTGVDSLIRGVSVISISSDHENMSLEPGVIDISE